MLVVWCGVVWWKVIIVSALSLSLRDKDRLRDREIERGWQYHANHFYFYLEVVGITLGISPCYGKRSLQTNKWFEHQLSFVFLKDAIYNSKDGHM